MMVKMVPDKTGRFAERPHYAPEDLDRECERIVSAFLRKKRGAVEKLLGYDQPRYAHHRLLTDATGRRFAKRDRDMTIRAMRERGMSAAQVIASALVAGGAVV